MARGVLNAVLAACLALPIQAFCPTQVLRASHRSRADPLSRLAAARSRVSGRSISAAGSSAFCDLRMREGKQPLQIPIIDLSAMSSQSEEARHAVGQQVRAACETGGFFYVTGHGIPEEVLEDAFACSRAFFSLPQVTKKALPSTSGGFTRGYIEMGGESGSAERFEVKEAFSYGFEWAEGMEWTNPMQGPNVWPEEAGQLDAEKWKSRTGGSWKATLTRYFQENVRVCEMISGALARALGKEEDDLLNLCRKGEGTSGGDSISLMRLFHYLPYGRAGDMGQGQERIGSSPHTDWGFLTLILQDPNVVGLQAFDQETGWHDVPPIPGTLICNVGDYVSLLTGGQFVSPLHRVVTADAERFSFVFFYYPSYEAVLPMAVEGRDMSLFKNQKVQEGCSEALPGGGGGDGGGGLIPHEVPFGEFILGKWEQVQRSVGAQ